MAQIQSYAVSKNKKRVRSPVNRIGGKCFLVNWLITFIPPHRVYVESFAGAGHLLFAKPPSPIEVINDVDCRLINFCKVIQDPETRQALVDRFSYMPYSRYLWQDLRVKWKQGYIPEDPVETAVEWFYLNKSTFSGDQKRGGFGCPSKSTNRNPAMTFANAIETLDHIAKRLKGVTVENLDYEDCIQRYDSPETLFYVDPPYLDSEFYYSDGFCHDDHQRLADMLHGIKGKAMVSHYQNGLYDDLYKGWHRFECQSFKGSHKAYKGNAKPKTTEILYCNFEPVQTQNELFKNI